MNAPDSNGLAFKSGPSSGMQGSAPHEAPDVRSRARALVAAKASDEAIAVLQEHLGRSPQDCEAALDLAEILLGDGRVDEAVTWLKRILTIRPGMIAARRSLGLAHYRLEQFDEAAARFQSVLDLHPDDASACFQLGRALNAAKKPEAAIEWLRKAHVLRPGDVEIAVELGNVSRALGQTDGAIEVFRAAHALDPDNLSISSSLGSALVDKRAFGEGAALLARVAERAPHDAGHWLNLAGAYLSDRRYAEAVASFRRAIAIQPGSVVAYCNIALALFSLGRLDEAIAACRTALVIEPGSAVANFNMACVLLALGRFEEAWPHYEFRFAIGGKTWAMDEAKAGPWQGEAPAGKSFLVIGEQGNGDHIQFCRYVAMLAERGARVTYLAPARLHSLLGSLGPSIRLVEPVPPEARFDYQVPLLSLPRWIGHSEPRVSDKPYLTAEPARVERWRSRIGPSGFRIGVAWQGNVYPSGDFRRAYRLESLRPVALLPGVRLISLQVGHATEQIDALPAGMTVERLGEDFDTGDQAFLDTAAVIAGLDLVISCDTSIAHLAGALGRPVWIALPFDPEWRWQRHREETDWYPTARLFRQKALDDWDGVFHDMSRALVGLLEDARPADAATADMAGPAPAIPTSWGRVLDRMSQLAASANPPREKNQGPGEAEELASLRAVIETNRGSLPSGWSAATNELRDTHVQLVATRAELEVLQKAGQFGERFIALSRDLLRLEQAREAAILSVGTCR